MIVLNSGGVIPPCTSPDQKHNWIVTRRPDNNRSGWHEERCLTCGCEIGYDDSD